MRKKPLITAAFILSLIVIALSAILICSACKDKNALPSWDISNGGSKITAGFSDNGRYGYILTIEGTGAMPDYSSKKDAPWYYRSGRITDIRISEGITSIGANSFSDIKAKTVVIPESATAVGENCFNEDTVLCAYKQITVPDGNSVYMYSETAPSTEGDFWRFRGEDAVIWQTTKILFIGNSFTYYSDIPSLFGKIATAADEPVIVESVTMGSWTLTKFSDENDEYGKMVDQKLKASSDYDVVVLQEQSTRPLDNYNEFLSGAKALQTKIKATQTKCQIYLYATWGYADEAAVRKVTIPEMEAQLRTAYQNAAQAMGVKVSYVGAAFSAVYNAHKDVNDNCFANPDAYKDSPEKAFYLYYSEDNKHPSYTGAYLSACVHVATILDLDPRLSTFTGEFYKINDTDTAEEKSEKQRLNEEISNALKTIAYETAHSN